MMIVESGNAFVFERISARTATASGCYNAIRIVNTQDIPSMPEDLRVVRSALEVEWSEGQTEGSYDLPLPEALEGA